VASGVQLEVRQIPSDVVSIQLLRWNMTTHESTYSTVSNGVEFIDDSMRAADFVTTTDTDVLPGNVYRYVARLIFTNGSYEDFGDATVEFMLPTPGQVDTKVENVTVDHTNVPNVRFDVTTITTDTDVQVVLKMLRDQGMQQFFQNDLQLQRDQLNDLVAHNVQRVDLTTGKREDFGVMTTQKFDDSLLRRNLAIDPLFYGHKYRYEITPLLRAPETLFSEHVKQSVDSNTNKQYSFKPSKFLHPAALKRGVLTTTTGASQRYAKEPMSYGAVGAVTPVEVSFDGDAASVVASSAMRFDRYLNVVTWSVLGDMNQVDHFLVFKQVNGVRTLVGKTHSEFAYGNCQYLHSLSNKDVGAITYVIVPIMDDYKVGRSSSTNVVLIEAI